MYVIITVINFEVWDHFCYTNIIEFVIISPMYINGKIWLGLHSSIRNSSVHIFSSASILM